MSLSITALFKARPGALPELRSHVEELVRQSRQEAACLRYDLHESRTEEPFLILWEEWADQPGLDFHNQQPYLDTFREKAGGLLAEPVVLFHSFPTEG